MDPRQLRAALHTLYFAGSSEERHAADAWLRGFSSQDRAWQVLAVLLADAAAAEHERFFAAQQLRLSCQRRDGVVAPDSVAALAPLLAGQMAAAAAGGCRHTLNQLAAALATLAARSPAWPEQEVLPRVIVLAREALRGMAGADGEQQQLVSLRLMAALAEAASSRDVGMRPERRQALLAALSASAAPLEAAQQAFRLDSGGGGGSLQAQAAALQLVQAWSGLGCPPAGSERCGGLWQHLHGLVLHPELGGMAAEALAALHGACVASDPGGGDGGKRRDRGPALLVGGAAAEHRRAQLRQLLLGLLPSFGSALQAALAQAGHSSQQARLLFAALALLGAAARSADAHAGCAAGADAAAAQAAHLAAEVALAALQHPQLEVTLAALQFWDEQLERWGGGGQPGGGQPGGSSSACTPHQRRELLQRLCGALLRRMLLPEGLPAHACTADARDLPDEVQKVRREAADTFRGAADVLGPADARRQLLQLAAQTAAAGAQLQQECCLYALNLVWGRQRAQQRREEAAAEAAAAAAAALAALAPAAPKLAGTALTLLGGMAEQLVLLTSLDSVPHCTMQQAGQSSDLLQALLDRLLQLLRLTADAKLSRNAATCCHRLTGCRALAAALAARHARWADALCSCFAEAGGMRQLPRSGEDLTTAQFLLASICHLAAAAAQGPGGAAASGNGGMLLLQRLLSQPAAAARAALAAATAAAAGSEEQREQLGCAAVQVETIAVALEAAAGEGTSDGSPSPLASHLPALLAGAASALQAAASMAAACAAPPAHGGSPPPLQPLVQAVCRVAAAVSGTPAAMDGLALLRPLLASPPGPCLLTALSQLVAGSSGDGGGSAARQELEAAVGASLRTAAAAHSADPDWQPALLTLSTLCLQRLPAAAAAPASLDALLTTAWHSMRSYHRAPCEAVLRFAETLCCVGCPTPRRQPAGSCRLPTSSPHAHPEPPGSGAGEAAAAAARQHLRQRLDAGLGWQLVQGLLLAAAGGMPPYMLVLVAYALHRTWLAVGTDRFGAWLQEAAQRAPEAEAPWRRWKPAAQAAALGELLSPLCAADARRFKRLFKVFCGGKKKGQHVEQPAREG